MENARVVLLVRCGEREEAGVAPARERGLRGWSGAPPGPEVEAEPDRPGLPRALALAARLADRLEREGLTVARVAHADDAACAQTALAFRSVLEDRRLARGGAAPFRALGPGGSARAAAREVERWAARSEPERAYLVVAGAAELDGLARELGCEAEVPLPLAAGECAALALSPPRGVAWRVACSPPERRARAEEALRRGARLARGLVGALLLGGAVLLALRAWAGGSALDRWVAELGALAWLAALALAVGALLAHERLAAARDRRRAPDGAGHGDAALQLLLELERVRRRLTIPALLAAVASLALLALRQVGHGLARSPWVALLGLLEVALVLGLAWLAYDRSRVDTRGEPRSEAPAAAARRAWSAATAFARARWDQLAAALSGKTRR